MEKDTILLQQKIIHFKSELAKYKEKVKDYQENYHYALLEKLKKENVKLLEEQNELKKDQNITYQELNKRIQGLEEQLAKAVRLQEEQVHETNLWKEKANQYQENYQDASQRVIALRKESSTLQYQFKQKQEKLETRDVELQKLQQQSNKKEAEYQSRLHEYEEESVCLKSRIKEMEATIKELKTINQEQESQLKYIIEGKKQLEQQNEEHDQNVQRYFQQTKKLEKLLTEAEEDLNEQRALQTETLKNSKVEINQLKQRNEELKNALDEWKEKQLSFQNQEKAWSEKKRALEQNQEELKEELKEKINSLTILQETNEQLKKQNEKILGIYSEGDVEGESGDLLALLDQQMKNILGQTFEYEEQLDSKMIFMKTLEEKIEQLGEEILQIEEEGVGADSKKNNNTE